MPDIKNIRFFHNGKVGQKGGTTVGYLFVDKERNKMLVTFARCSDAKNSTDTFSKEKSRFICRGRIEKGVKVQLVEKPAGMDRYEFLLGLIADNDKRVKEARGKNHQTTS